MSAPILPPNATINPYTFYLNVLDLSFYGHPAEGFKIRMGILFGLNGTAILLALIYFGMLYLESNRKDSNVRKLWLFKLVQRPSGRYIATNQALWSTVMTVVSSAVVLGHVHNGYKVYVSHEDLAAAATWKCLSFIPLLAHSYIISWAILQAFLLTPDQYDNHFLSAKVANSLFIGIGMLLLVGLLISSVIITHISDVIYNQASTITDTLKVLEPTWNGAGLNSKAGIELLLLMLPLADAGAKFTISLFNQAAFLCVLPLIIASINLASIGVAKVLRKQINSNLETFGTLSYGYNNRGGENTIYSQDSEIKNFSDELKKSFSSRSRRFSDLPPPTRKFSEVPSSKQIKFYANNDNDQLNEENVWEIDQARRILILQKAERDLILISTFLALVLLGTAVLFIWITVSLGQVITKSETVLNWTKVEVALFGSEWIYSITVNLTLIFLIYNAYITLINPIKLDPIEIISNDIVSIHEMFGDKGDLEAERFYLDSIISSRRPTTTTTSIGGNSSNLEVVVEIKVEVDIDEGSIEKV